jgi:hypothetical protein
MLCCTAHACVGQTKYHHPPPVHLPPLLVIPMAAANPTAGPSTDNFTAIFNAASKEYDRLTGKRLNNHPLAAQLHTCKNPDDVSGVLRIQAQAFSKFRQGDERLVAVRLLLHLSLRSSLPIGAPHSPTSHSPRNGIHMSKLQAGYKDWTFGLCTVSLLPLLLSITTCLPVLTLAQ